MGLPKQSKTAAIMLCDLGAAQAILSDPGNRMVNVFMCMLEGRHLPQAVKVVATVKTASVHSRKLECRRWHISMPQWIWGPELANGTNQSKAQGAHNLRALVWQVPNVLDQPGVGTRHGSQGACWDDCSPCQFVLIQVTASFPSPASCWCATWEITWSPGLT